MVDPFVMYLIFIVLFLILLLWFAWTESCARNLYMEESMKCMKSCSDSLEKMAASVK